MSATSASATITVNAVLAAGTVGSIQTIAIGAIPAVLTSLTLPTGGTGAYTYLWQSSIDNAVWLDIGGEVGLTYTPGVLNQSMWYRRAETSGACGTVYTASTAITTELWICVGATTPSTVSMTTAGGGGGGYTYKWQKSTDNSSWTDIAGEVGETITPDAITADTWYRRGVSTASCGPMYTTSIKASLGSGPGKAATGILDWLDSTSYLSSAGVTTYDVSSYSNDIIGIGKECYFYQKQSEATDDSVKIFMSTLAASNDANVGTITNDVSYVMIGHDKGRLRATAAANAEKPASVVNRLAREWKVTNTNFSDSYSIEIEWDSVGAFDLSHMRLLVDDDGDFSNATVFAAGDAGLTFAIGSIIVGGIGIAHIPAGVTKFITLGSVDAATALPIELVDFSVTQEA